MPYKEHDNNQCLFKLARAIKTLEVKGETFALPRLESVFNEWYRLAEDYLRAGQTREEYFMEFMNACEKAIHPLGGRVVGEAWERAVSRSLPSEAMKFENPKLRFLVAFLKQMQVTADMEPFFITSRDCAALLQIENHTTVAGWLGGLTKLGYLKVATPGNAHQATRYFYIWGAPK